MKSVLSYFNINVMLVLLLDAFCLKQIQCKMIFLLEKLTSLTK